MLVVVVLVVAVEGKRRLGECTRRQTSSLLLRTRAGGQQAWVAKMNVKMIYMTSCLAMISQPTPTEVITLTNYHTLLIDNECFGS